MEANENMKDSIYFVNMKPMTRKPPKYVSFPYWEKPTPENQCVLWLGQNTFIGTSNIVPEYAINKMKTARLSTKEEISMYRKYEKLSQI